MHFHRIVLYSLCGLFGSILTFPVLGQIKLEHSLQLKREMVGAGVEQLSLRNQGDTLRVLALLVDFPPDTDTLTTGNGKFQLSGSLSGLFDPPPHDATYFSDKLQFLSNYFRKVSNGRVNIRGEVFGQVVTLSKPMSSYSPPKDGSDEERLANFVLESWHAADSLYPALQFNRYDAFVIFHAGVGRDLDLVSILGFDPTPYDIPSLTFTLKTFRQYLNDASFSGIAVDGGAFKITNTLLLPETETRPLRSGNRIDTLQLSINGLLAASFGTYLGLPDLFDTKTGRSAIGQFGLMDGAAIGAYTGLFPPEPSAWEKVYLGWVTPVTVSSQSLIISLPAVGLTEVGQDTIYKIPINDREYFLIENRSRDPHLNGQRLTIRQGGITLTRHFGGDTTGFRLDDLGGISGSVVDVEDFDWALPGLTTSDEAFRGGGVLIWHIDEDVIARGLVDNTVNANINLRGVDLEEADGSQDIGRVYEQLQAGSGTELGWPLDCWFSGNTAPVYKNVFDKDSHPNSRSNTNAHSLITIKDFSKRSPRMTATVLRGDDIARPIGNFPKTLSGDHLGYIYPFDADGDETSELFLTRTSFAQKDGDGWSPTGRGAIFGWKQTGAPIYSDTIGIVAEIDKPTILGMAFSKHPLNGSSYVAAAGEDRVYLWNMEDRDGDSRFDRIAKVSSSQIFTTFIDTFLVAYGGQTIDIISLDGVSRSIARSANDICRIGSTTKIAALELTKLSIINVQTAQIENTYDMNERAEYVVSGDVVGNGKTQIIAVVNHSETPTSGRIRKRLIVLDEEGRVLRNLGQIDSYCDPTEALQSAPILADLDGDGRKEILVLSSKGRLFAFNAQGIPVSGFPVQMGSDPYPIRSGPVIGDIDGDKNPDILAVSYWGDLWVYRYKINHQPENLLKLQAGSPWMPTLFAARRSDATFALGVASVDALGRVSALEFSSPFNASTTLWPMHHYDPSQTSFAALTTANPAPISRDFLPAGRVYNWPNPVYGSTTQIRYYTPEDANISIKIFDLAGTKIAELESRAIGGIDGDVTWDVSHIQSGVYFARIEATGSNRSEVAIIKIAVVK